MSLITFIELLKYITETYGKCRGVFAIGRHNFILKLNQQQHLKVSAAAQSMWIFNEASIEAVYDRLSIA